MELRLAAYADLPARVGARRTAPGLSGDSAVREALKRTLGAQAPERAVLVEELGLLQGRVRADMVLVDDDTHAYEIKSERDSLRRLPGQVLGYSGTMDYVTLVVDPRHQGASLRRVPVWWGVWLAVRDGANHVDLCPLREARRNPALEVRQLVQLLWRGDALAMLSRRGPVARYDRWPRSLLWERLCQSCSVDEVRAEVRRRLRERAGQPVARPPQ